MKIGIPVESGQAMIQRVIDSSVAAKWIFDEELKEKAVSLLERVRHKEIRAVVPEIFYIEMANICWKWVRRKAMRYETVVNALDSILELPLERYSDNELADVALENASRFNISAYDGAYLALAEIYAAPLITADEALLRACRGRFDFIERLNRDSDHLLNHS